MMGFEDQTTFRGLYSALICQCGPFCCKACSQIDNGMLHQFLSLCLIFSKCDIYRTEPNFRLGTHLLCTSVWSVLSSAFLFFY